MNVDGEGGEEGMKMEEKLVFMWGYLPGALPQRTPILSPVVVRLPQGGTSWKDVCGGGCGFAMAISDSGKLITWGSTDDLGQSYVTSGKHGEMPEPFPLPTEAVIVKAAAGWAHCAAVTAGGEVYTWGWKECVPSGKVFGDPSTGASIEKDALEKQSLLLTEQVSPRSHGSRSSGGSVSGGDSRGTDETTKRRRVSPGKQAAESSSSVDETLSAFPCLVTLNPGVRIASVAAGGRHTLALSDVGQVWGWGYGGEGQLVWGHGSEWCLLLILYPASTPPSTKIALWAFHVEAWVQKVRALEFLEITSKRLHVEVDIVQQLQVSLLLFMQPGQCDWWCTSFLSILANAGALLTFGWGLYGQCGQGSTDDELSPTCVSSLLGIRIEGVAAGLWHTICISADGTGADQAETLPRLLDAPSLENVHAKVVSCGARHSAVVTEDGKTFCWGWNKYGQLGLGDVIDRNIPSQVPIDGCAARNVACGWWHTLLLAESPT
ncbi:UNVERIFIED_CONTAM: Ultraviolet-B receptor UVR8 [Sesamum latifolium]|uniref:Ultraviolet-B receptor UVR8 n=1 Tax=Sesamum latifolium TaxID=2727402 RepID=A0AAW2XGC1_9LAMI